MRRVIWFVTICAAGLGGYYLGQQPNSPRVFEWMFRNVEQFEQSGGSEWVSDKVDAGRQGVASIFSGAGHEDTKAEDATAPGLQETVVADREPLPIPRCW